MGKLDSAIIAALKLDPALTSVSSHGGSGFSSTNKITISDSAKKPKVYFMKTGKGTDAETMFKGEYASLNAIHDAVPSLCPKAYAHGALQESSGYYLVTDFLDLSSRTSDSSSSSQSLAQKLAKLHSTPQPAEYNNRFGFPVGTCCGSTLQDNTWEDSWAKFYGERRLIAILKGSEHNNGSDAELRRYVEHTVSEVVPRLLGALDVKPVVVHGDLWSGNASRGRIGGEGSIEEVVFDSSAVYGHNEFEMGIMKMFGGFGSAFFKEYHDIVPKTEPTAEYEDRIQLYMLYHQLNHHAIFGGGYRSGAVSTMKGLLAKYGGGR